MRAAGLLQRSTARALDHDCLTVAQATAYSGIVALFPALVLAAALVGMLPFSLPLRMQMAIFFDRVLPPTVSPLLDAYFQATHGTPHTMRVLTGAVLVSLTGATSVMATLMEGFRRAYGLGEERNVWLARRRALLLVPLSQMPFAAASAVVVFGNLLTLWLAQHMAEGVRGSVLLAAMVVRWSVAVLGCIAILTVVYHMGTPMEGRQKQTQGGRSWGDVVPGAAVATALWFVTTMIFGWYVTRLANYSEVYGSLGAGIALLIWLYLVALCVLFGAEFNAQLFLSRSRGSRNLGEIASKMAVNDGDAS